ncbi:hypothetical protein CL3_25700 [butyrate-producing bacterium SM4/1]|nr:hypothetical protein CL3_25700 [butyrate-producing bacterium SM4/1]
MPDGESGIFFDMGLSGSYDGRNLKDAGEAAEHSRAQHGGSSQNACHGGCDLPDSRGHLHSPQKTGTKEASRRGKNGRERRPG